MLKYMEWKKILDENRRRLIILLGIMSLKKLQKPSINMREANDRQEQKNSQNTLLNGKIHAYHYDRLAIVYIRQSTLQQVERHSESTKLQYNLVERAYDLGWPADKVLIIDDDLEQSGS